MVAAESGTFESSLASKVEVLADCVYAMCDRRSGELPGPGALLRRLVGPVGIEIVPSGVALGEATIEYGPRFGRPDFGHWVRSVRLLGGQRVEQLTLACAIACARIASWIREESIEPAVAYAVSLAIIMPIHCIDEDAVTMSVGEIAACYRVDPPVAAARLRMLRGGARCGSGERPAIVLG